MDYVLLLVVSLLVSAEGRIITNSSSLPARKTILTAYGDTYDCVDFYKQPAFAHPRLKNFTFDYKMMSRPQNLELEEEGCPMGAVPIRRFSKVDLSREKVANGAVYKAIGRKTGTNTYIGAGAFISSHNPKVTGQQYSATRVKLQNGPDSIEAGWRVDPKLYGDTQTRIYIRTDAGNAHCFNLLCPGFVLTGPKSILELPVTKITKPGQPIPELQLYILRDQQGNWNLQLGPNRGVLGFWPSNIFTSLTSFASNIEWGAEVYDPNPIPTAQMGSGKLKGDGFDAYFRQCSEYTMNGQQVDANDIEAVSDSKFYSSEQGFYGSDFKRLVQYGGPN